MEFLPKKGVSGTLYLYLQPEGVWHVVTWDGGRYHSHGAKDTLEELRAYVDNLRWGDGWTRVECRAPTRKMDPCVRVEFQFQSGRVQRLTGEQAEAWLKNVNDIVAAGELRYGQTQMNDYPWEFSRVDP